MKDRAAILKILSVQNFVLLIMIKIALYLGRICKYGLKQLHLVWKCFLVSNIQLSWLIDRPYHGLGH